uniref:Putative secreted protein n=1 Tax=Anopheles darlingi TaxID=43151 RepID=A0A2M4D6T2_ANODA
MITYLTNITLDFIAFSFSSFLLVTLLRDRAVASHCFLFSYFLSLSPSLSKPHQARNSLIFWIGFWGEFLLLNSARIELMIINLKFRPSSC